jgi:hypothetical protein
VCNECDCESVRASSNGYHEKDIVIPFEPFVLKISGFRNGATAASATGRQVGEEIPSDAGTNISNGHYPSSVTVRGTISFADSR